MKIFTNENDIEYNSFIYIWYDLKTNKKYIGSHIGSIDDGYKFSGLNIRKEYAMRQNDFKREILSYRLIETQKQIREIEEQYLILNDVENNDEFYNRTNKAYGGYHKKSVDERLLDIDENGLNAFERAAIKMVKTRKKNNSYETAKIKEFKTKNLNTIKLNATKDKISKTLMNSVWVNKDSIAKYIKEKDLEFYLNDGWRKGIKHDLDYNTCSNIAKENNIKSISEWRAFVKNNNYPRNPDVKYKKEWINWNAFLQK